MTDVLFAGGKSAYLYNYIKWDCARTDEATHIAGGKWGLKPPRTLSIVEHKTPDSVR